MQRQLFELLARLVPRLPSSMAGSLAVLAAGMTYRSAPILRATSLHNLSRLLDLPEQHPWVRRAALGAFCTLARNYVDMLTVTTLSREQVLRRTEVVGFERLVEAQGRGQGVVLATAHLGNVDYGGQALLVRGARCGILTERIEPDWLFGFFVRERAHFGGQVVPFSPGVLTRLQRMLREGVAVGIACDWDMQGTGIPVRLPGFPCALSIPAGIGLLALRAKAPIIPVWTERLPDGRTRAYVEPEVPVSPTGNLRADVAQVSRALAERLLPELRARPRQWVLFHRVWQEETDAVPAPGREVLEAGEAAARRAAGSTRRSPGERKAGVS